MPTEERPEELSTQVQEGGDNAPSTGDEGDGSSDPVDQLGVPMNREPTLDDVRSDGEAHRRFALGCSVAVVLLVVGFWLVRVLWLGGRP